MSQLRQRQSELDELDVAAVVVTFQAGHLERAYVEETGLEWPLLVDETRDLYRGYGMEHGRGWDLFGPSAVWVYLKLLLSGRRLRAPSGDPRQLGGDVLLDPGGTVRLHHVGRGPADRPTVDALLEAVRTHRASDWRKKE